MARIFPLILIFASLSSADVAVSTYGAKANDARDDSAEVQRALYAAGKQVSSYQPWPGAVYRISGSTVRFAPGRYLIGTSLVIPVGVSLEGYGAVLIGAGNDGFVSGAAWRISVRGLTFDGFGDALRLANNNTDTGRMAFDDLVFQDCKTGVTTVRYEDSRSTIFTMRNCHGINTDVVAKAYCDIAVIENCWATHSGHNGPAFIIDSKAAFRSCAFVSGGDPNNHARCWVEFYASDQIRTLTIDSCRVSSEAGGVVLVRSHAKAKTDYMGADAGQTGIFVRDSTVYSGGTMIELKELCNVVSVTGTSGGVCYTRAIVGPPIPQDKKMFFSFTADPASFRALTADGHFKLLSDGLE